MKVDISGKKYGKLTVLHQIESKIKKNSYWLCRCECGNEKIICKSTLNKGLLSCGCSTPKATPPPLKFDIVGKVKNNLTAIKPLGGKYSIWLVRCICGKEIKIQKNDFVDGKRKSCGCIKPVHKISSIEEFLKKVSKTDTCWIWIGSFRKKTGYGQFGIASKTITAHRASWIFHKGEIPKGKLICHHCDNRLCVNPNHLYIGTHKTNALDRVLRNFDSFKKVKKCV
jgi:hypothetical protein